MSIIKLQCAAPLITKILKEQPYDPIENYRLSIWCITESVPDGQLLYNVFTKELILKKKDELSDKQFLVNHWFYIRKDCNERSIVDQFRAFIRSVRNQHDSILNYTILTTTNCNARCFYCFEKGCKKATLRTKTAMDLAKFMVAHREPNEKISLHWFGGEPLLNTKSIDTITDYLKERKANYISTITTNGFLFSNIMIKRAIMDWGLKKAQITLDGTANVYNRTKNYVTHTNRAFDIVIDNIEHLVNEGVDVVVRMNLTTENYEALHRLILFLNDRFPQSCKIRVNIFPLFELFHDTFIRKKIFKNLMSLEESLFNVGIANGYEYFSHVRMNHCKADNNLNSIVVFPDGNVGLCEHEWQKMYIGKINANESFNQDIVAQWNQYLYLEQCNSCALYPDCMKLKKCETDNFCFQEIIDFDKYIIKLEMLKRYYQYETKV